MDYKAMKTFYILGGYETSQGLRWSRYFSR